MRDRQIAHFLSRDIAGETALETERAEQAAVDEGLEALAGDGRNQLASDDVQRIVVGVSGAEIAGRLEVAQAADHVVARERIRLRPEHQVAGAEAESRAMRQQIDDVEFAADPFVVQRERRDVIHDFVVPGEPALVDEHRQRRRGHRLAVGGDAKQRGAVHRLRPAELAQAVAARVHHGAVLDHAEGDTRHRKRLHRRGHRAIDGARTGQGRTGAQQTGR